MLNNGMSFLQPIVANNAEKPYALAILTIVFILIIAYFFMDLSYKEHAGHFLGKKSYGLQNDLKKDLFYLPEKPIIKNYDNSNLYEEIAEKAGVISDFEPIEFLDNDRKWLIQFWEGQQGIFIDAEIGAYCKDRELAEILSLYMGDFYRSDYE